MNEIVKRLLPEIDLVLAELAAKRSAARLEHLAWLESNWGRICQAAFGHLEAELADLKAQTTKTGLWHVLNSEVDLLGPLEQQYREVAHTQALAYLFNPTGSHGFGGEVLRLFLKHLLPMAKHRPDLQHAPALIAEMVRESDEADVEPERRLKWTPKTGPKAKV